MKYKRAKQCALAFPVGTTLVTTGTWNPIHAQETTQTIPTDLAKTGNVEINETNFPDKAFRNYIKETLSELESVTRIDISNNKQIKSLKGIEYFTKLSYLDCDSTGILSFYLSNNSLLQNVDISNNSRSFAITSDRVSLQSIDPNLNGAKISNLQNATLSADKQFFENYVFGTPITYDYDCGNPTLAITMDVTLTSKNENIWITPLKIENWTYGEEAKQPFASAKYRTPSYLYSDNKDGTFTEVVPTTLGTWYVKAIVEEDAAYTGLKSEVVEFTISPKQLTDKSITSTDVKKESDELIIKDGATTLGLIEII